MPPGRKAVSRMRVWERWLWEISKTEKFSTDTRGNSGNLFAADGVK
jgi:hypothetical protein